jgi:hypothetical protein
VDEVSEMPEPYITIVIEGEVILFDDDASTACRVPAERWPPPGAASPEVIPWPPPLHIFDETSILPPPIVPPPQEPPKKDP